MGKVNQILQKTIIGLIRLYQWGLSPVLPHSCRYWPSCSDYFCQAVIQRGLLQGVYYGLCRLVRCHPWHEGGYDPVPSPKTENKLNRYGTS